MPIPRVTKSPRHKGIFREPTLEFESEVVGQMPALVVAPQKPESVRIPDLEGPQIQNTLLLLIRDNVPDVGRFNTSMLKYPRST